MTLRRMAGSVVAAGLAFAMPAACATAESKSCVKLVTEPDGSSHLAMEQHDGKVTAFELGPAYGQLDIVSREGEKRSFIIDGATQVHCAAEPGRLLPPEACIAQGSNVYVDWFLDALCRQRAYHIFDADRWPSGLTLPPPPPELAEDLVPLKLRPGKPPAQ